VIPFVHLRRSSRTTSLIVKRVDGNPTCYEQRVLSALIRERGPKRLLEIGTFNGLSTLNMACNTAKDALITTVDVEEHSLEDLVLPLHETGRYQDARYIRKNAIGQLFRERPEAGKITQILCDSALLETKGLGQFDFIFIDGSHSYEYTMNDSRFALRHLEGSGTVLWHDYGKLCWPGVKEAINELQRGGLSLWQIHNTSFVLFSPNKAWPTSGEGGASAEKRESSWFEPRHPRGSRS
jgi:hypothetical protein